MDRSKIVVISLVVVIVAGTTAWSWVNFFHSPDYDPEKAHLFLERFYARCVAAHDESVCDPVVGNDHRRCFQDHLQYPSSDADDHTEAVLYDLEAYLGCMDDGVDRVLRSLDR